MSWRKKILSITSGLYPGAEMALIAIQPKIIHQSLEHILRKAEMLL